MKIRNNTNYKLVFYFGNPHEEEPEAVITLKTGEEVDCDKLPAGQISIQEN